MSEAHPFELNYGHLGEPVYDSENQEWRFARKPVITQKLQPLGQPVAALRGSRKHDLNVCQNATERAQNIRHLTHQYPELLPSATFLPDLAQKSEAVVEVTSSHDPTVSDLLAFGRALVGKRTRRGAATVPIAAVPGGSGGEAVRLVLLSKEQLAWEDSKNVKLSSLTAKGGELAWWFGNGSAIQQLVFADMEGEAAPWLAVRDVQYDKLGRCAMPEKGQMYTDNHICFYQLSILFNDLALSETIYAGSKMNFTSTIDPPELRIRKGSVKTPARVSDEFILSDGVVYHDFRDPEAVIEQAGIYQHSELSEPELLSGDDDKFANLQFALPVRRKVSASNLGKSRESTARSSSPLASSQISEDVGFMPSFQPAALPTPELTPSPHSQNSASSLQASEDPASLRLKAYCSLATQPSLPIKMSNILKEWEIGGDPDSYNWEVSQRALHTDESEDESQAKERQQSEKRRKRQRQDTVASSSQPPPKRSEGSQQQAQEAQGSSQPTQSLTTASQPEPGRFGGSHSKHKKKKFGSQGKRPGF
ncbi:RNA polymerase I-specific transcription initiation factor RRN6, partial [Lecanoromycetidae sp. Uapishka_2]